MHYALSPEADRDLDAIFDHSVEQFGFQQAVDYLEKFAALFITLTAHPEMGRQRPEIRPELRSFAMEQHVAFYRILDSQIRIVRVLHASRDLPNLFFE